MHANMKMEWAVEGSVQPMTGCIVILRRLICEGTNRLNVNDGALRSVE